MKHQKGFTLIELLVATTIIIVLSAIGVVSFMNSGKSARDSRRKADMETVRQAMVLYRAENGTYPTVNNGGFSSDQYEQLIENLGDNISKPAPKEAKNGHTAYMARRNAQQKICVCATMEDSNNGNVPSMSCQNWNSVGTHYCVISP